MEKLTKNDILWCLAVSHGREFEHYRKYYNEQHVPTPYTYYYITNDILFKTGEMGRAIRLLQYHLGLLVMSREQKVTQPDHFTFYELLWEAFKVWSFNLTVDDRDRLCDGDWREWVKEERASWKEEKQ